MSKRIDYSDTGDGTVTWFLDNSLNFIRGFVSADQLARMNSILLDSSELDMQMQTGALGFKFPSTLALEKVLVGARAHASASQDPDNLVLQWSNDATHFWDGTWTTQVFAWPAIGTQEVVVATPTGSPVNCKFLQIRFRNAAGAYVTGSTILAWYDVHIFGEYDEADAFYEYYQTDEATPIETNYFSFGNVNPADAPISTSQVFKVKNLEGVTRTYVLTTDDVKYAAETEFSGLFTFSTNAGVAKVSGMTLTVSAGSFSSRVEWWFDANATEMSSLADGFHYAKALAAVS